MEYNIDEFLSKLEELKEWGTLNGGFVTTENIQEIFPGLDDNQNKLITEYLEKNRIGFNEPVDAGEFLSESDNGYLSLYLEELEELEVTDDAKRRVYIMGAINGQSDACENLINAYLKNVVDVAKLYAGQGATLQDLIGEGNVALAQTVALLGCVDEPEEADGLIMRRVMDAMEDYLNLENESSKKEEKALALVIQVTDKAKEMYEDLYRKVTVEELSEASGISKKKILEAIRITDKCLEYIEKPEEDNESNND